MLRNVYIFFHMHIGQQFNSKMKLLLNIIVECNHLWYDVCGLERFTNNSITKVRSTPVKQMTV